MHHKASLRRALPLVLIALLLPALAPGLRAATTEELYEQARVQYRFLIKEPEKHRNATPGKNVSPTSSRP